MPIVRRSVSVSKNTIRFGSHVKDNTARDFVPALYDVLGRDYHHVVLDFRRCVRAYAPAVLPIICLLDHRRLRGNTFHVLLPEDATLRQLFLNANWAHFMDPSHPRLDLESRHHLAARRYNTPGGQQDVVQAAVDVVLRNVDLQRDVISGIEWVVNEITDNVLNHAQAPEGGLVQVSTFRDDHKVQLVVADAGRGIPEAMRVAFTDLRDDASALDEAIKAGVTSIPDSGQGNGLAGSIRIASFARGSFKVASGKAQLSIFQDGAVGEYRTQRVQAPFGHRFPGTLVAFEIATNVDFKVSEALALDGRHQELVDVVDLRYAGKGGELLVRVRDEALGCGTRHAGRELRRKCMNLLNAEPGKELTLDWSGVPVISSSFADEAIGKLFVQLGPTTFSARMRHAGAEQLVRSLLDRAVMQRVAQEIGERG